MFALGGFERKGKLRMKSYVIGALLAFGLAMPASAATIDFTANNATNGNVLDTTWNVYAGGPVGSSLSNALHDHVAGCNDAGWTFTCKPSSGQYDVGFGVNGGGNNEEIDGKLGVNEFVEVVFGKKVQVTGFAGMLTYANSSLKGAREQVELQFWNGVSWVFAALAEPKAIINQIPADGDTSFDTVGLAYTTGLSIFTTKVRFFATGEGSSDDGSFNVTAAGLQVAPVPVPAGLPLMLTGLGALAWAARRKARKSA
jgi:hypothetical protein